MCNTSYGSQTSPHTEVQELLRPHEYDSYLGGGRCLLSGPTLGPLTQPLGALFKGEHEKIFDDIKEGTEGSGYKIFSIVENMPFIFNVSGVQHR